jgi:hypothetical protein
VLADAERAGDDVRQRGLVRHVEAAHDVFAQRGVEIRDPTGDKYVPGMALSVLAFQPTPGLLHEKIIETIKPTILYRDQILQRGDVIVGTPEEADEEAVAQAPAAQQTASGIPTVDAAALPDAAPP